MKLFVYNYREFDEAKYFQEYSKKYGVELTVTSESPTVENAGKLSGYDAVSIITTPVGRDILTTMKERGIRCVSTRTIGVDHIDLEAAQELGLTICNAVYPPDSVANYTIMLMLMCCRKVVPILKWAEVQNYGLRGKQGRELSSSTVGVMGTGSIGRTVIKHLSGFGCRILAYDLYENDEVKQFAEYVDRETMYREADIISLHMPLTEENYHLIDREALNRMREGVILVNTARGELIDEEALIDAVESGKVGAAGLDVVKGEAGLYYGDHMDRALVKRNMAILRGFPNVLVTPHTAFYTDEAVASMVHSTIQGCLLAVEGKENPFVYRR